MPNFARRAAPISALLKGDAQDLRWTSQHSAIVDTFLDELRQHEGLALPDSTKPFVLEVDCGQGGYGGILMQSLTERLRPVACVSKQTVWGTEVPVE